MMFIKLTPTAKAPCLAACCLFALSLPPAARAETPASQPVTALIDQLVEVDSMETFYAHSFRFKYFAPVDRAPLAPYPLSNASPRESAYRALIHLVEKGPEALPSLLEHLDDERKTATSVTDDFAKSMGPSAFLDFRSGDPREASAAEEAGLPRTNPGPDFDITIDDYTLTVGDMCFVLIGMITNRSYYVLVDEFDAQLNSPTSSSEIVTAVREKWGAHPEPVDLYEHLKRDLESDNTLYSGSAARRLLYYFSKASDNLVIAKLGALINSHQPGNEDLADFLEAISWTSHPRIMSAMRRFLESADDPAQIAAAAPVYSVNPDPRGWEQLAQLADKLKLRRDPSYVEASRIILKLNLLSFPGNREDTIRRFLGGAGAYAQTSACVVCEDLGNVPVSALAPLLAIKDQSTGDQYPVKGKGMPDDAYLPYRICDRAYETISRLLGDKNALATGTAEEMDARIATLAERLAGPPASWPFAGQETEIRNKARSTPQ